MSQHRKHRGYKTERVVAGYLSQWWPGASVGRGMGKDIVNIPMDIAVKARSDFKPLEWLRQATKRASCRMNGQGEDAAEYLAFVKFSDLVSLLVKAGYKIGRAHV